MSVSSIAAPSPVKAPEASEQKAAEVKTDSNADDSRTVLAPLPPGQGTRIDQLA